MKKYISKSLEDTKIIADKVFKLNKKTIAIFGEIGAGKTTFTKFFAKNFGVEDVSSPTFPIVHEYNNDLIHMDLYRIKSVDELYDIDFESYFDKMAVIIIEWPQIALDLLPSGTLFINIQQNEFRTFLIGDNYDNFI